MKRFWSILLSLLMVVTLLPTFHVHEAHAAYDATGTFTKVETVNDLTAGSYYVLYGISGTYTGALTAAASINRPKATAVTITAEGTIVNPELDIVWLLGGSTDAWTLYNENKDRYCEVTKNSTSGFAMNQTASTAYTVSVDASEGFRFISNHASANGRGISLYQTDFRPYALSSMNTLHLYKYTPSTGGTDYSLLNIAISSAQNLIANTTSSEDGSGVTFGDYWATAANIATLNSAITTAQALLESEVQEDVDAGVTTLQAAITAFEGQRTLSNDASGIQDIATLKTQTTGTAQTVKGWLVYRYGGSVADTMNCAVIEDYSDNGSINGLVIYLNALSDYSIGDYVYVSGTYSPYNGMPEITNVTASGLAAAPEGEVAPTAQQYASWAAATADFANINGEVICIPSVTLGAYDATTTTHTDSLSGSITAYRGVAYDGANSENTTVIAGSLVNLYGMFEANTSTSVYRMRVGYPRNYELSDTTVQYAVSIDAGANGTLLVEDANGDEVLNGTLVDHGTVLTITATPDEDYILDSLTVNGNEITNGGTYTVIGETTIAATFKQPASYTVSYIVPADCTAIAADNVVEGDALATLPTPSETTIGDYTFVGWMVQDAGFVDDQTSAPTYVSAPYTPTASVTLVAIYTKTSGEGGAGYTMVNGAAEVTAGTYLIGALRSTAATDDFYFATATIDGGDMNTNETATTITAVEGVRSITTPPEGAVEFTFAGNSTDGYTITPNGTDYLGWSSYANRSLALGAAYSGTTWTAIDKDEPIIAGGVNLVGKNGTETPYTLSENSTAVSAIRAYANATQYRAIYLFKSGGSSSTYYNANPSTEVSTYSVTISAGENGTVLVEDANGDEVISGNSYPAGTLLTITAAPTDSANYELATLTVNGNDFTSGETYTVTGATTIEATFSQIIRYTVDFINQGAAYGEAQTVVAGDAVTLAAGLTGLGDYTFAGWMIQDANFQNDTTEAPTLYNTTYTPTATVTLVAIYSKTAGSLTYYTTVPTEVRKYSVTFTDGFGNTLGDPQWVEEGDGATAPADPTHTGYTFEGWDIPFDSVEAHITVTATWTLNSYALTISCGENGSLTVSYYVDGALTYAADGDLIPYDTVLTINATPAANCKVTSLTVDGVEQESGSTFSMPAAAATVAATFAAKEQYTITYMELGEQYDSYTVYEGEALTFEALGTTVGDYTFAGWIIDTEDAYATDNTTAPTVYTEDYVDYVPTANTTFKAVYIKTSGGEGGTNASDLFISEYIEGSGNNKAIEIFNGTGSAVDLSAYTVCLYANGHLEADNTHSFAAGTMLQNGETYVLYNSSATDAFKAALNSESSSACNFNGDDAIALLKDGTAIDVFGIIGEDPGSAWTGTQTNGNEYTTVNKTWVRIDSVAAPVTTWNVDEWTIYDKDTSTYLGSHTMSGGASIVYNTNPEIPCAHANTEIRDAVAATCVATGLTAGSKCSVCNEVLVAQEEVAIDPNNHVGETEIRDALAATNVAAGYTGDTYCLGCDAKIASGEIIPMLTDTPVTGIRTLGAQAKVDTWDAMRFGASFNVEALKAALEAGDTFNYGFRAALKSRMNDTDLLGTNSFVGATYYAKNGGIEWLAEYENMTAEELANALSAAGAKVFTYDETTITFVLVIKNVPVQSAENIVFRPFTEVKNNMTFGAQMYNNLKAIMDAYDLGNGGGASVMFPSEQ